MPMIDDVKIPTTLWVKGDENVAFWLSLTRKGDKTELFNALLTAARKAYIEHAADFVMAARSNSLTITFDSDGSESTP